MNPEDLLKFDYDRNSKKVVSRNEIDHAKLLSMMSKPKFGRQIVLLTQFFRKNRKEFSHQRFFAC